ncbi:MAG: cell wall/surface repeat protein [Mucilaginibacter sp.]|nr:cell wall/surface repeat protein [Mucilaginibacter sp.]
MKKEITLIKNSAPLQKSRAHSKLYNTIWYMLLLLTVFTAGCKKDDYKGEIHGVCPVVATDPADKAVNVVLGKIISATFNTAMNPATINSTTFTITQGSTAVAGTVAPTSNNAVFTFTPAAPLLPFTVYTGTITTGATDTLRTALVSNYVWTFTTIPQLTLTSSPVGGGTTTGAGLFAQSSSVTVTATPAAGFTFVNWTNGAAVASTNASYSFNMAGNMALVANFAPIVRFTVVTSSNPVAGGTTTGSGSYNSGSAVTTTATANAGYNFTSWTEGGVVVSTNPSYTFNILANRTLAANFAAIVAPGAPPVLGNNFSLFGAIGGSAGITNQGVNTVINNGAIGTTAAPTLITGFHDGLTNDSYTETGSNIGLVTGGIYSAPPAPGTIPKFNTVTQALIEANALYISISPANKPGGSDPGAGQLGGLTLAPGVYKSASGTFAITNPVQIATGDLVLDAKGDPNAVWIFQAPTSLTVGIAGPAGARSISLINGAQAKNVYWYVGSAATINGAGGGVMVGTIIATSGITFSTAGVAAQTVLNGRAISLVASVTMVNTTINTQ